MSDWYFIVFLIATPIAVHISVALEIIRSEYDSQKYYKMSSVQWARFKIKCFFWELALPVMIFRLVGAVAEEVYDTITTALQKEDEPKL